MKILIVDDDAQQLERYQSVIEEFSKQKSLSITSEVKKSLSEGLKALDHDFDGAVVDLKLSNSTAEAEGNTLIRRIRENKRFPICVVTGFEGDLDPAFAEELQRGPNLFFRLDKRDKPFEAILDHLVSIHQSGITRIMGSQGIFETTLNTIFWTHLARAMVYWNSNSESSKNRENRLVRFTLSHLLSKLDIDTDGKSDDYYPDEMYIMPSLQDSLQTGDILKKNEDDLHFLVITPACDLAQGKTKSIQMLEIESFAQGIIATNVNLIKKTVSSTMNEEALNIHNAKVADARATLNRIASNSYANKYHILPCSESFPGGLLNFQKVTSIKLQDVGTSYSKIGAIAPGFIKDIVSRFSSYYGRQGQPNFHLDHVVQKLLR